MFPIAHAYLLERLIPSPTPVQYLGCIWPDMLFNGPLTHHQTHREGLALLAYVRTSALQLLPFMQAVLTHGSEPHGFDWYSDEAYDPGAPKGYAFERARPFVPAVIAATQVDPEIGLWKAHNFVEMSFEVALDQRAPHLKRAIAAACADVDLVRFVVEPLSRFFQQPMEALASNIQRFPETVALHDVTPATLASAYAIQLRLKHAVTDPSIPAMATIIADVWEAISRQPTPVPDSEIFLETCAREVAAVLAL